MVQFLNDFNEANSDNQGVRLYKDGTSQEFNTATKVAFGSVFDPNGEINVEATAQRMADNALKDDQTLNNTDNGPGFGGPGAVA